MKDLYCRPESLAEADRSIISRGWTSDQASKVITELCQTYGARFAGSVEERAAARYLQQLMDGYGLDEIELEPFNYQGWKRGSTRLLPVEGRELECIGLPYSPSGRVVGEVVDLGDGTPADYSFHGDNLEGRIALVSARRPLYARQAMHRRDKYLRAVEAGATGFLWMREEGGHLEETGGLPHNAPIPALGISRETGFLIQNKVSSDPSLQMLIEARHSKEEVTSFNVVGKLKGNKPEAPYLVAGAHYDGHDIAQGALDNAAGTAVVMEAAGLLADHRKVLERSIGFVLFGAEEVGLLGSRHHVEELGPEEVSFMINLDGGAGRPVGNMGLALQDWPELIPLFRQLATDMGHHELTVAVDFGEHSDMFSFAQRGIPSGYFKAMDERETGRGWVHTRADTLDKIYQERLREDALLLARLLLRLSCLKEWPAKERKLSEISGLKEAGRE